MPDFAPCYWQFYPDCRCLRASETTVFSPHEVKVFLCTDNLKEFMKGTCQLFPVQGGKYECYLPASKRASVHEIHQLPSLKLLHAKATKGDDGSLNLSFGLQVPWRVRDFKALFRIGGKNCGLVKVALFTSRYASCRVSAYAVPVAELPFGIRGSGEAKNMDSVREPDARYFAAELPQGGEVFCRLVLSGTALKAKDVELWVSGYEAPARVPERNLVELRRTCLPLPHPDGFPLNLRIW